MGPAPQLIVTAVAGPAAGLRSVRRGQRGGVVGLAGDVALEAADDLGLGLVLAIRRWA